MMQALDRYFDAWNSHDPAQVVAALTDGGTYEDPTTGGPLSGDALAASVAGVYEAFPDVRFEIESLSLGDGTASAEWRMIGTNTGPAPRRSRHRRDPSTCPAPTSSPTTRPRIG